MEKGLVVMRIASAKLTVFGSIITGEPFQVEFESEICDDGSPLTPQILFEWEREQIEETRAARTIKYFTTVLTVVSADTGREYLP